MATWKCSRRARIGAAVLIALVALSGCGDSAISPQATSRAKSLWSMRSAYVGDSSRVSALVRKVFPASAFGYTLSLRTEAHPFTVTVRIDRIAKPIQLVDFSEQATLILGLIANVDVVTVVSADTSYALTASDATMSLGYDVKDFGRSEVRLESYIRAQEAD